MNDLEKSKLDRFVKDESMNKAVYSFIREAFLEPSGTKDVQILAAERLAVDMLAEAWKQLGKFRETEDNPSKIQTQVGL